jgi:hypothetical protein
MNQINIKMRKPRTIQQLVERQNQILGYKYIITEDSPFNQNQIQNPQPQQEQPPMDSRPEPQIQGQEVSFDGSTPDGQVGDTKEVDVTDLIKGQEEVTQKVDSFNQQMTALNQVLSNLESKINQMDDLVGKINSIETELKEMNPTQEEKLEMVSLNTYPYNVTLKDFWKDKLDNVSSLELKPKSEDNTQDKEKEEVVFELTDEVIDDYNTKDIEKSFYPEDKDSKQF